LGLRKRRKKLTTLLTSIDRRLRSVESVTVPTRIARRTVTADNIQPGVVPSTDPKDGGATGSTSSDTAPVEFAIVTAATYSPKNVTGSTDWMEVTTATDHNLAKGDKVSIYGLNNNLVTGNGTFAVTEVVSSTIFRYSPALNGFYQNAVTMSISATISQRSRTTTTATLKLSSANHGYAVGDVITVTDVPDQTDYNGTFFIKSVSGDTITYDFPSALSSSEAIVDSVGTTHSVIHKYAIIGDTWIDTSVTPNTVKVWNGLIWTDTSNLPDGVIIDDHMAPAPPTGLSATQNGYYEASSGVAKIAVNLAWTAPTTNADGSTLRDLAGYKVFYKYVAGVTDTGSAGTGSVDTTTTNTDGTISGTFNWQTNDFGSSPVLTLSTSAGTVYPTTYTLSAAATSKSLQWTISGLSQDQQATLSWSTPSSGSGDVTAAAGSTTIISHNEIAASNWRSDVFGNTTVNSSTQPTASDPVSGGPSNAATDWQAGPDTNQTTASIDGLDTSSEIQFAVQAYDSSKKNFSVYSDALTVTTGTPALVLNPPSKPTTSVRLGTVTVKWDGLDNAGHTPPPSLDHIEVHLGTTSGFTPGQSTFKDTIYYTSGITGGYVVIDGLTYNSTWYAKLVAISTTSIKTSGSVASDSFTITPLVDTDLIANTLTNWPFVGGVVNAAALANAAVSARTLAQNAITSSNIANVITPGAISTGLIAANAIGADQIAAGSIIAGKLGANAVTATTIAANAITAGKLDVNAVTADTIAAGAITTSKINASYVYAGSLSANQINAGTLSASYISGGTIAASDFQTVNWASGSGVKISANNNSITFNKNGSAAGFILPFSPSAGFNGGVLLHGGSTADSTGGTTPLIAVGETNTAGVNIMTNNSEFGVSAASAWLTSSGDTTVGARFGSGNNLYLSSTNTYLGSQQTGAATNVYIGKAGTTSNIYADSTTLTTTGTTALISTAAVPGGTITLNSGGTVGIYGGGRSTAGVGTYTDGILLDFGFVRVPDAYARTVGSGKTLLVSSAGTLNVASSSRKYKQDISNLPPVDIEKFKLLQPVSFRYKQAVAEEGDSAPTAIGFIAEQAVEIGLELFVAFEKDENDNLEPDNFKYTDYIAGLHSVVQQQQAIIEDLSARISILESK
jgi:Chaperone of endosialidase